MKIKNLILLLVFTNTIIPLQAKRPSPPDDYAIYTVYIFNFTKYVIWPSGSKAVKIGVVENVEAESHLQKMAKSKSTPGAEITVINSHNESDLASCQIIFVPANSTGLVSKLIEHFKGQPILIVTESPDLIRKGAAISFKVVSGKLRFQVNEDAISARGMKISSYLTSLADK